MQWWLCPRLRAWSGGSGDFIIGDTLRVIPFMRMLVYRSPRPGNNRERS